MTSITIFIFLCYGIFFYAYRSKQNKYSKTQTSEELEKELKTKEKALAVQLIDETRAAGARLKPACNILGISERTYQRWIKDGKVKEDLRPTAHRPSPKNKLTEKEREKVIKVANSSEFADLPPVKSAG